MQSPDMFNRERFVTSAVRSQAALRPYLPADAPLLAEIFRAAIAELAADDYSEAQRTAWAEAADDEDAFAARLAGALTLVATIDGAAAGFASLRGAEIDMLYVHPAVAGQGVGTILCDALEKLAAARGVTRLTADASDTALGFFTHRGFVAERRNSVPKGGEWLANTTVSKTIAEAESSKPGPPVRNPDPLGRRTGPPDRNQTPPARGAGSHGPGRSVSPATNRNDRAAGEDNS
jgi:putative acetyltransferase